MSGSPVLGCQACRCRPPAPCLQVKHAKAEIKKIIQEQSERAFRREQLPGGTAPGRYTL